MRNAFRLGLALAFFASASLAQVSIPRTTAINNAQPTFSVDPATGLPIQGPGVTLVGPGSTITNPIFIANAESADATGTFTNATQTTSVTNTTADGYATALLSINGTYGTASGAFEESDDSGTTWYSIICTRSDGSATETGYTGLTNTNRQWSCPVAGNDSVRIRSTAVASGTVNARVGISAPTNNSGVVSGSVTAAPYIFTSTGFQQVASFSTSTGFTPAAGSKICYIQAEGNPVRYRTDGVAPTATIGQLLPTGVQLAETASLSTIRFIPTTGSSTLDVDCYL